jgi:hypothetical protein
MAIINGNKIIEIWKSPLKNLEEGLRATEALIPDSDDLTVWQFVAFFQ